MFHSFQSVGFITFLVKFIPKYFILFNVIINKILFLISFLVCSLLLHRNRIGFCILIFSPVTLLNSFINFNNCFLVDSLGFSISKIMSPKNKDSLMSSFLIWIFLFHSWLIALAKDLVLYPSRKSEFLLSVTTENELSVPASITR